MSRIFPQAGLLVLLSALTAGLSACGSPAEAVRTPAPPEIRVIVDATELASAFERREPDAIELFGGKHGRIKGIFAKTEPLADGHIAMTFKTSIETFRPVRCIFDAAASTALNTLAAGDEVTVTGKIVGFADSRYFVTVDDCLIDKEGQ